MGFKNWIKGYEKVYNNELKEWQEKSGMKAIIPKGFGEELLKQYSAYKSESATKNLVIVTWVLALATITLNLLTLILR